MGSTARRAWTGPSTAGEPQIRGQTKISLNKEAGVHDRLLIRRRILAARRRMCVCVLVSGEQRVNVCV